MCAALSGCTSAGVLAIWHSCVQRRAGALERVFLPFGVRVCSAERVLLRGWFCHVGGVKATSTCGWVNTRYLLVVLMFWGVGGAFVLTCSEMFIGYKYRRIITYKGINVTLVL